ncbi:MAG: hypothetical protein RTU92_08945 [Candidatus Thorarchaeota archaeon]
MNCRLKNLRERITELISLDVEPLETNDDDEYHQTLCETEWVRILLIRSMGITDTAKLEVEMALPKWSKSWWGLDKEDHSPEVQSHVKNLLNCTKTHIDYILSLQEAGFLVEIIGREFLCTATIEFESTILKDSALLEVLVPPD